MRTSFLLAASIASMFTIASIHQSAEAQMMMQTPTQPAAKPSPAKPKAAKPGQPRSTARGYLPRAGGKGPGRCGAFMYWKGGRCVDARTGKK